MRNQVVKLLQSWKEVDGNVNSLEELIQWINELNMNTYVDIRECSINESTFWFYDDYNGEVLNRKRSFFSVKGMRRFENGHFVCEQPMIIQPEIGYLGIICKEIDGVLNFLMQAKIEPGNINCVQISPTIQATKSNFTRAHGGKLPLYFEYFENANKYHVIYDQIQSEQAARFYQKRNRNMIMEIDEEIEIYENFRWMTLGQIKCLMQRDNLVNMDTRTVLSGIPLIGDYLSLEDKSLIKSLFGTEELYQSIFNTNPIPGVTQLYQQLNSYKMFQEIETVFVPLNQLVDWSVDDMGIVCQKKASYMVRYYDIDISGREVQHWNQPLFKAIGKATFGLITRKNRGCMEFLVSMRPEIGTFDKIEIGPSIQWEASHNEVDDTCVDKFFRNRLSEKKGILFNHLLSEEGGRFYHEQNNNVILDIKENELSEIPEGYFWVSYATLNYMVQINNCLNIQLRNLLSLLVI